MKYTIEEAADLVVRRTHAIHNDTNNFLLLSKVLETSYPNDNEGRVFDFAAYEEFLIFGWNRNEAGTWANVGSYLEELMPIYLSEIIDEKKIEVETFTISKEDYDRFKELESEQMSECSLRDYFAAKAMSRLKGIDVEWIAEKSYLMADAMLKQRKQ